MKFKSTIIVSIAVLSASLFMVACGEKPTEQAVVASSPTQANSEPKNVGAKSIANDLAIYKDIVLSKSIDETGWRSFLADYARLAASKKDISDKELAYAAFPEIATIRDPFKRDEAVNAKSVELKDIRSAAMPKVRIVSPSTASLSQYDMEKEQYSISFGSAGEEFTTRWDIGNAGTAYLSLKYCMEKGQGGRCAGGRTVDIKVPKDRARVIEAELAKRNSRTVALGLYSSVRGFSYWENAPERSTIDLTIEGASLHFLNSRDEWDSDYKNTIIFLDGPDLQSVNINR